MKNGVLIRILGNDLRTLHGDRQTIDNLKFTLRHECEFEGIEKIFLLNRLCSEEKREEILEILNAFGIAHFEIPFSFSEFLNISGERLTKKEFSLLSRKDKVKFLYPFNLYLINNNGSRNYCIDYAKRQGYDWVFPLDSNNFLTRASYEKLAQGLKKRTQYIVLPQYRIMDAGLSNDDWATQAYELDGLPIHEPQLGFSTSCRHRFNEKICYGCGPKAEMLNALGVEGEWNKWRDNEKYLSIKTRRFWLTRTQVIGESVRLNPLSRRNEKSANWNLRQEGLYELVRNLWEK
ncbi:MAG: hypothetical protein Q7Q71_04580 [Verrucomicrobiota bacterium JB023]|nr:hypothetical protein [Verrucomicrobiota bacterium JB023]